MNNTILHFHNIPQLNISEHFICYKKLSLKHSGEENTSYPNSVSGEMKAPNPKVVGSSKGTIGIVGPLLVCVILTHELALCDMRDKNWWHKKQSQISIILMQQFKP